jgi:PAS domain S-box-containing protein
VRDLLIIGGVLVALFALGAALGVFEQLSDWLLTREQRGGAFALLTLVAAGGAVFSALRWRQAEVEKRKRIEAERRYRQLVEQAPVVTYAWDPTRPTGEISTSFVSPQIEALLGYSADEWTADPALRILRIHPDDRDEVLARSDEADRTGRGSHMEYRAVHREGRIVWIHDESRPVTWREDGTPTLVQGVMVDITRTKNAEDQQRETQRRFQALVERLPAVTYVEDAETGAYRYLSPQIEELSGYPVQRWIDDPDFWAKAVHPDDRERVLAENEADTGDSWSADYRMLRPDGRTVWVHNESVLIRGEGGTPIEWVGVCTDLTEQKEAWDQVRAAEERFRAIVEHIPAAVYLDMPDGSMQSVYVSPQVETVMGITVERYIDEPDLWLQMMDGEDRRRCERRYLEAVEAGRSWEDEYRIRKPDGKLAWIHDETTFIGDADGRPLFLLGVLYDVTPRKRAEETLRECERREHAAAERLRTLDDMKNTFLAAVSPRAAVSPDLDPGDLVHPRANDRPRRGGSPRPRRPTDRQRAEARPSPERPSRPRPAQRRDRRATTADL